MNFQAPFPYAAFQTRSGNFTADASGLVANVSPQNGTAVADLIQAGCVPVDASPLTPFRNVLNGGDFTTNPWQRDVAGLATSHANTSAISNTVTYFPDRWFAVGGASSSIVLTKLTDTTLPGFGSALQMTRTASNTDTAAFNLGQVVETTNAVKLQGQQVTFSFYARTAANYSGGNLTVTLASGTGTNQSAANLVAGSWTSQANVFSVAQALTNNMTRYSFSGTVPTTATQLGILLTWTPAGTAGTTDGIIFQGFQLEAGGLSVFEHRDAQTELEICQRYAFLVNEPAAGVVVGMGTVPSTNNETWFIPLPVQMYKAPAVTTAVGTFKTNSTGTPTAATGLTGGTTHTPNAISVVATGTGTAGMGTLLQGGGGSGYILASADF